MFKIERDRPAVVTGGTGEEIDPRLSKRANSLICALAAQGFQPHDITSILSDAMAQVNVLFSQKLEHAHENVKNSTEEVLECIEKNWPQQDKLVEAFEQKMQGVMALKGMFDATIAPAMGLRPRPAYASKAEERRAEPRREQGNPWESGNPGEIKDC